MKRGGPLRRKGWMKRGRKGLRRYTALKAKNEERLAERRAKTDGPQAAYCRAAACYACGAPPPSDPEHVRTRAAGGLDRDTVPLCRTCHRYRHDHGIKALNRLRGVDLRAEADRLARVYHPPGGSA